MPKTFNEICDYVWCNQPHVRQWSQEKFERFIRFHFNEGFICIVLDVDESIAGVAMIRPVLSPMDALDPFKYDQEGNCLHISQVVCTAKGAIISLGFAVLARFGMREYVSWHRPPRLKLIVHKASVLRRNLFRMEHNGIRP